MNKYYKTLGVTEESTKEEIKSAYRKLLKKYHPDTYAGDKSFAEKKSAEINIAYAQVIADRDVKGYATPKKTNVKTNKEPRQQKTENITKRRPYEDKKTEFSTEIKAENVNTEEKPSENNSNQNIDLESYAKKVAENSASKIPDLYMSEQEMKDELKAKHILDGLIISLSLITVIMILLIIFL